MDVDTKQRLLYNATELREVLGIGRGLVYKLLSRDDFPKIVVNGHYYIPIDKLQKWIDKESKRC